MRLLLRRAARGLGRQPVWITVALVLDVVIAVTGILIGPRFNLTGALAVGPLLACARCNGRLTALAAGFALALCALVAGGRCAAVLAIFRELAFGEPGLTGLAEQMNARLSRDMEAEDFVTVILAEFAPGEVRIVNCGHHPPVKLAAGAGELQVIAP